MIPAHDLGRLILIFLPPLFSIVDARSAEKQILDCLFTTNIDTEGKISKESPGRAGGIVMLPTRTAGAPIGGFSPIKTLLFGLAFLQFLILDIFSDDSLIYTDCTYEIPTSPEFPTPELLPYLWNLLEHANGHPPLDRPNHLAHRHLRWDGQKQMYMVVRNGSFQNLHPFPFAYPSYPVPGLPSNPSPENPISILRAENNVIIA
jgi:hypothetical protein